MITGMGAWSAMGRNLAAFEEGLREGRVVRRPVTRFEVSDAAYRTREASVLADEERLTNDVDETLIADLAVRVAQDAMVDARLVRERVRSCRLGVALGTSHGGNIAFMRFIKGLVGAPGGSVDHRLLLSTGATLVGQIASRVGAAGETLTVSTACASSCDAIGRAAEVIRFGRADVMLAGGADLFTELSFSGFNILGALSRGVSRPCNEDRDGMMLGDAAAMVVLESEAHAASRGARVYAELAGYAIGNDVHHPTAPEPEGIHEVSGPSLNILPMDYHLDRITEITNAS